MSIFRIFELLSWGVSAVLAIWLLADLFRTNRKYSEETLMSSREGEIESELVIERTIDMADGGRA